MIGALVSYVALVGLFAVPAGLVAVAMRSTVGARVEAWLDGPCPDCGAGTGERCHWSCSSHWD